MRAAESRTATKDEPERADVDRGDRSECLDDMEILFDECRAGQAKMGLDLEEIPQGRISVQARAPRSDSEAVARNAP